MKSLSVILPTFNEAACIKDLLADLKRQAGVDLEIVVVDGGSTDDTVQIARDAGASVLVSAKGRGVQMNAGASRSRHPLLLFLHADSRLPSDSLLADALAAFAGVDQRSAAGHFPLRFERRGGGHDFFYRRLESKTRLNRPGTVNGDQGLLISRRWFETLGGFDTRLPFLEDQRISRRIFEQGHWVLLPGHLVTSARRFESEGPTDRYTVMALMMGAQACGLEDFLGSAQDLYRSQDKTARLHAGTFAHQLRSCIRRRGWRGLGTLYNGGRYVRENTWQLFHLLDLMGRDGRGRALDFYDRHVERLLNNPVGDTLATALLCVWLYAVLPLRHRLRRV